MNLTKGDVERLGRRAQQPVKAPNELLAVWVSGRLMNPLNERQSAPYFAGKHARYKRQWKERIADALLETGWTGAGLRYMAASPKHIHFHAIVPKKFDAIDGLRAAMKAFPDALKDCGVIHGDHDGAGHRFEYTQEASRKKAPGVEIRVCALDGEPGRA